MIDLSHPGVHYPCGRFNHGMAHLRMQGLLAHINDRNVAASQAAEALEIALVTQKGYVSYYLLDVDPDWLKQLGEYRQIFKERLNEARSFVENENQKEPRNSKNEKYRLKFETLVRRKDVNIP